MAAPLPTWANRGSDNRLFQGRVFGNQHEEMIQRGRVSADKPPIIVLYSFRCKVPDSSRAFAPEVKNMVDSVILKQETGTLLFCDQSDHSTRGHVP